jgi:regulator of sigma E protease
MILLTLLVFLVLLSILVLIHEAGHYFVAKKFGIKVEEFGFGLPPRIWGKKIGETIYSINWLPIGGFVKLYGEDEAGAGRLEAPKEHDHSAKDIHRAFYSRPVWQRASVIVAGVVMNTILAVLIYYVFLFLGGFHAELPLFGNHHFFGVNQKIVTTIVVSDISKGSPAQEAGITPFSKIVSIDGRKITDIDEFLRLIKEHTGSAVTLTWQDLQTNKISTGTMIPRIHPPVGQGALGVAFYPVNTVLLSYDSPSQKLFSGFVHPANLMVYNFAVLGDFIGASVKEKSVTPLRKTVSGPIGIGFLVDSIISIPDAKERMMQLLNLAGLLSASLALFNVLPFPGLDGGRLFFILIEVVSRKKINPKIEGYVNAVGMLLLLLLIFFVSINDISMHTDSILHFFKTLLHL